MNHFTIEELCWTREALMAYRLDVENKAPAYMKAVLDALVKRFQDEIDRRN